MASNNYSQHLRQLVQKDNIEKVIQELSELLQNSPHLDEALLHSARWDDLKKQIRLGQLSYEESNVSKNQIRLAVLELINEIEEQTEDPIIEKEVTQHVQTISGKNIVSGSQIQAGGDVNIGDRIQNVTESKTSKRIRLFLFLFVPLLAIVLGVLYVKYQQSQQPLTLTVFLDNQTPNPHLPFDGGNLILKYNGKADNQLTKSEATFKAIPANNRNKAVELRFAAEGFKTVDTTIILNSETINLPIYRDDTYQRMYGKVEDEKGNPVEKARIKLDDVNLETFTNASGEFSINIPFDKQRAQQRLSVSKAAYASFDRTEPVNKDKAIRIQLIQN